MSAITFAGEMQGVNGVAVGGSDGRGVSGVTLGGGSVATAAGSGDGVAVTFGVAQPCRTMSAARATTAART